jgi:hypothetical protein
VLLLDGWAVSWRPRQSRGRNKTALQRASANFLRRYRNRGNGLRLVVMYGHTCQPPSESDNYEIGKVAIHCLFIVAISPRTSSNPAVPTRRFCVATSFWPVSAHSDRVSPAKRV